MSFLSNSKGKTVSNGRQENKSLISKTNSHQNVSAVGNASATFTPIVKNKSAHFPSEKDKNSKNSHNSPEDKKSRVSPFHVVHSFFLDQLERERAEREKLQKQTKERLEKEKKKKMEVLAKLKESGKANEQLLRNKDWKPMGGLGANIGTQEWKHKTQLHNKMLKFSKEIKRANCQKIKCVPFMSVSQLHNGPRNDPRSLAIQYSKGIPRPKLMAGEQVLSNLPHSQSRDYITEMERLDMNHMKYMEMMRQM